MRRERVNYFGGGWHLRETPKFVDFVVYGGELADHLNGKVGIYPKYLQEWDGDGDMGRGWKTYARVFRTRPLNGRLVGVYFIGGRQNEEYRVVWEY